MPAGGLREARRRPMPRRRKAYCLVNGRHTSEEAGQSGLSGLVWGTWEGRGTLVEQEKNGGVGCP